MKTSLLRPISIILTAALFLATAGSPLFAQPPRGGKPGGGPPPSNHGGGRPGGPPPPNRGGRPPVPPRPWGPPPPPSRHHHDDFGRTMAILGAVGVTAAVVNGMSRYDYYRRSQQPVIVMPSQPSTVVVERPVAVERTITVEKQAATSSFDEGTYSPKLGASFRIEKIQIPGNKFVAARLVSDPVEGSPLEKLKLRQGDVITRLDDNAVDSLSELDRHEKNTLVRYIRTGTTKVVLAKVYIPTDAEALVIPDDEYNAP